MLMRIINPTVPIVALVVICCFVVNGQKVDGYLQGLVVDQLGAIVAGAKISIESESLKREIKSDENGTFKTVLPTGTYRVKVEYPGFDESRFAKVRIKEKGTKEMKVILKARPVKFGKCPKGQTCIWL